MKVTLKFNNLAAVSHAMSKERTRYYICGVYVTESVMVVTDGHILVKIGESEETPKSDDLIIPDDIVKAILQAGKSLGKALPVTIEVDGEKGSYSAKVTNGCEIRIIPFKSIDGTFPDYNRVIPSYSETDTVNAIGFNSDLLTTMGKAVKDFTGTKSPCLKMTFTDAASAVLIGPITNEFEDKLTGIIMPMRI